MKLIIDSMNFNKDGSVDIMAHARMWLEVANSTYLDPASSKPCFEVQEIKKVAP